MPPYVNHHYRPLKYHFRSCSRIRNFVVDLLALWLSAYGVYAEQSADHDFIFVVYGVLLTRHPITNLSCELDPKSLLFLSHTGLAYEHDA